MTKILSRIILCISMLFCSATVFAEYVPTKLFVYGFSASFNDSTVYITEVMELDSAWVEKHKRFLYSRDNYSAQLKEFMQSLGVSRPTCIISFAKTQKAAEKKREKLLKKYTHPGKNYTVNVLKGNAFRFEPISAADDYDASHKLTKEERKALKAEAKQQKKEAKAKIKAKKDKDKQVKRENKAKHKAEKKARKK